MQNHWPPGKILPVQEILPKNPKESDLPKLPYQINGYKRCPNLIYCIWKSGRHAAMRTSCGSWRCDSCAKLKLDEMTQILSDATIDSPLVYDIITTPRESQTILKTFRRKQISALSLKFQDEIYLIASEYVQGRNWKLNGLSRASAIANLHRLNIHALRRRDFINDWKPEPKYEPKKDTVIYSTTFNNMEDLERIIGEYGIDVRSEFIDDDPVDVIERLVKMRGDLTIQFGEFDYLVE